MMLHPSENNMEGLVVCGVGGGGEEAGLVVAAPAPFPTQPLRFHLVFVTRFVFFLLLLYLHMRRGRKGSFFQSPFDNFRENRNRSFYNFPTTCRKRISIIRVRKVLFSPWSYHKFNNILFINVCFSVWK